MYIYILNYIIYWIWLAGGTSETISPWKLHVLGDYACTAPVCVCVYVCVCIYLHDSAPVVPGAHLVEREQRHAEVLEVAVVV